MSIKLDTVAEYIHNVGAGVVAPDVKMHRDCDNFLTKAITDTAIRNFKNDQKITEGIVTKYTFSAVVISVGILIAAGVFSGGLGLGIVIGILGAALLARAFFSDGNLISLDSPNSARREYEIPSHAGTSELWQNLNKLRRIVGETGIGLAAGAAIQSASAPRPGERVVI